MNTGNTEEHHSSDGSSSVDPRDIIEQYADSELSELSQPRIDDLDAEVSRLLDHQSSGSDSGDEPGNPQQEQTETEKRETPTKVPYKLTSVRRIGVVAAPPHVEDTADSTVIHNLHSSTPDSSNKDEPNIPIRDLMPGKVTAEAQMKIPMSVAHGPFKEETAHTHVTRQIEGDDRIMLTTTNAMPPLSLRENLLLHRLQSDQSLKSAQSESLLGTPSASSSQLFDDSDECTPKPLAEELEEADHEKAVDNHLNEVMLDFIDSGDSSNSEFDTSEEESDEEDLESDEQQSSEENIQFELCESDPFPHRTSNKERSPLLAALTTASQSTYVEGYALTNKVSRGSDSDEQRASMEGFQSPPDENYRNKGDDVTARSTVNKGKESDKCQTREVHPMHKSLNTVPAAGARTMDRYQDPVLHQRAQMTEVLIAEKHMPLLLASRQPNVDNVVKDSSQSTEMEPVKPAREVNQTPNESKVHSSSIPNGELPPRPNIASSENCVSIEQGSYAYSTVKEKSSGHLPAVAESHQRVSCEKESSVTHPHSNVRQISGADPQMMGLISQRSVLQHKMLSKGPPTNEPCSRHATATLDKMMQPPSATSRTQISEKKTAGESGDALVISNTDAGLMSSDVRDEANDQQRGGPDEEKSNATQPEKQLKLEDLTVTDSEARIVSSACEVTVSNDAHNFMSISSSNTQQRFIQVQVPRPSLTTAEVQPRPPLKGILKKKSRYEKGTSTASAESDGTTVTPQASDASSENSVKKALTERKREQISLSTVHSLPLVSVEAKVKHFLSSSSVPPLPSEMVPLAMDCDKTISTSGCDNSSSSTSSSHDDSDLNRTLTKDPTTAMHHIPLSSDIHDHSLSSQMQPENVLPLDNDATLVASDDEVPHVNVKISPRNEKLLPVNSTARQIQLNSSPATAHCSLTSDIQPPADHDPKLTLDHLTHTDNEATLRSSDDATPAEEPDGLHRQDKTSSQDKANGSLADKVKYTQCM